MHKQFPAEFAALMHQWKDTAAGLGDDHPHARRLWHLAMQTAPDWFVDEMHQMARDMGLLPTARQCNILGEPIYTVDEVAASLGVSTEEAEASFAQMLAERKALGLPTDGMVTKTADSLHTMH